MRYAIVKDGKVINIAVSGHPLAADWVAVPVGCPVCIGDTYSDGVFYAPEGNMRMSPEVEMIYKMFAAQNAEVN